MSETTHALQGETHRTMPRSNAVRALAKCLPLIALAVFGTMLARTFGALDSGAIWVALTSLQPWQWVGALACTALSFRAVGVYDILVHRVLQTGQSSRAARSSGVKAIAVSQALGFGTLTSALVRWRCLPNLGAPEIARLSAIVSLSFLASLAVVAALFVPLSGLIPQTRGLVVSGAAALLGLIILAKLAFRLGWIPTQVRAATLVSLLVATTADTVFAAAALWVLWPDALSFHLIFAAYLVALGAGLLSNAPGGIGAFDLSLLALLPVADDAAAMAALLAFRTIYYALPASIALLSLIRATPVPAVFDHALIHPEAGLSRQTARVFQHPKAALLMLPCWGTGIILGDLPHMMTVSDLHHADSPRAFYKCSARQAMKARAAGWQALRCADEAVLDLSDWSLAGAPRRQLRRALKTFEASNLIIRPVHNMSQLAPVAAAWARGHGGERGHSMGRFCPDYLRHQRVFAAFDGAVPVAFVSFHTGDIWTLDLMRYDPNPDNGPLARGTMQALVYAGLCAAIAANADHLSLAAVPTPPRHLPFAKNIHDTSKGLVRFKQAFAPTWQPRYICAPSKIQLAITVATLTYAIQRPCRLPNPKFIQRNDEDYSFAQIQPPCEAQPPLLGAFRNVPDQIQRPV